MSSIGFLGAIDSIGYTGFIDSLSSIGSTGFKKINGVLGFALTKHDDIAYHIIK